VKRARRTNAEWSEATTGALVRRAREAFGEAGYAAASVEQIAEEAGLTKGAVYYHYRSKRGLFEAVFRDVSREIVTRIEERADAAPDPWEAVAAGCEAFLDVALDDELRQIALVDAPNVLGWATWRAIDGEHGLGALKAGLRACGTGELDTDTLALLLSGAMNEGVFCIAEAPDRAATHERVRLSLRALLAVAR